MKPNNSKLNLVLKIKKNELLQDQVPTAKQIQMPKPDLIFQ